MSLLERPQPRPGVLKIQAYVPGKSSAPGVDKVFKLSSNETPLGASPKAIEAYGAVGRHLEDYPDGASTDLREAIGRAFGLDPSRIVCGAGSDGCCGAGAACCGAGVLAGCCARSGIAASAQTAADVSRAFETFIFIKSCDREFRLSAARRALPCY